MLLLPVAARKPHLLLEYDYWPHAPKLERENFDVHLQSRAIARALQHFGSDNSHYCFLDQLKLLGIILVLSAR